MRHYLVTLATAIVLLGSTAHASVANESASNRGVILVLSPAGDLRVLSGSESIGPFEDECGGLAPEITHCEISYEWPQDNVLWSGFYFPDCEDPAASVGGFGVNPCFTGTLKLTYWGSGSYFSCDVFPVHPDPYWAPNNPTAPLNRCTSNIASDPLLDPGSVIRGECDARMYSPLSAEPGGVGRWMCFMTSF